MLSVQIIEVFGGLAFQIVLDLKFVYKWCEVQTKSLSMQSNN